jgi:glycosidase
VGTEQTSEAPGSVETRPEWVPDAVFYQIFADRFARSARASTDVDPWDSPPTRENFLGGDLDGMRERLPHLVELGVTAVYLTPIFAAETNHRYDTTDYLRIDPRLGDQAAFERLLSAAHDSGIRVVLDAVFHHCGWGHWAFEDVRRRGADSPYRDWFYVPELPIRREPEPNYGTCSGCWYLPKLNVDEPSLRAHLFDVTRHWTRLGIDGWRLDVPYMMENLAFWAQFREVVREINPEAYVVAEVWDAASDWTTGKTSDAAMNYRLRDALLRFLVDRRSGARALADELAVIDQEVGEPAAWHMLNLLASHDTARLRSSCGGEAPLSRLAFALLFALRGAPMIYYGDEVGALGLNDPECRAGMPWDESAWEHETLAFVRSIARLRSASIALRRGDQQVTYPHDDVVVITRRHDHQVVSVYANRMNVATTVPLVAPGRDMLTGEILSAGTVVLPPREARFVEESSSS